MRHAKSPQGERTGGAGAAGRRTFDSGHKASRCNTGLLSASIRSGLAAAGTPSTAWRPATAPITITAGGRRCAARDAMSASVPVTVRWPAVVPCSITAAGVSASRPAAMSLAAIVASVDTPIRITSVSTAVASRAQSTLASSLAGSSWPVTTAKEDPSRRWLTGIPAAAGTATADETPGTISTGTPARRQASASSPPRPNTKGSPPFRRTTRRPASAW
jgi:hypothetical protein